MLGEYRKKRALICAHDSLRIQQTCHLAANGFFLFSLSLLSCPPFPQSERMLYSALAMNVNRYAVYVKGEYLV